MSKNVSSVGEPPPSAYSLKDKSLSADGILYSKTLPQKARTSIDNANALMQKLEESSANSETTHALKEELFKTVCELHQHLAESSLNKDVFEKIQREMENTIEACSNHLQPEKVGDTHLALKTKLRAHDVRFALQGLSCAVPENLKTTFSDLVRKGENLESCIPLDTAISSEDLDGIQTRIDLFDKEVKSFEQSLVAGLATDLGVPGDVAKQIFEAAQHNWKPLITEMPNGIIKQNHNIKGLKIYRLPEGRLVADFGIKDIGSGSYKRAKGMQRIGDTTIVRLTSREKDADQKEQFFFDIKTEMDARKLLSGVPNITKITEINYLNKKGKLRTRYIMEKYDTDVSKMIQQGSEKPSLVKALNCCKGVLSGLVEIHKRKLNHGDLKAANVLCLGNEGFLNDFGLLSSNGTMMEYRGNATYWAPETLTYDSPMWDHSMDMFSLGILLLDITDPSLASWFREFTKKLQEYVENPENKVSDKQYKAWYKKGHDELQKALMNGPTSTPLRQLVQSLTSYDPQRRPTAEQAKAAFDGLMKKGGGVPMLINVSKPPPLPGLRFENLIKTK